MAASVHDRLLNRAREEGRRFDVLLQYYAMERFLFRLSKSKHAANYLLKGALLLYARSVAQSRMTRDIDLWGIGANTVSFLEEMVRDCMEVDVQDDGLRFDADSVSANEIAPEAAYQGVRVNFIAYLGTARISMQVDVGFGDAVTPAPIQLGYPTLLDHEAPQLSGYPLETVVSEKYQAMVYLGLLNSRMKDFFDIWFISSSFEFSGTEICAAIKATFDRRDTPIPDSFPEELIVEFAADAAKRAQWDSFLRKRGLDSLGLRLTEALDRAEKFLGPPTRSLAEGKTFASKWHSGGEWV